MFWKMIKINIFISILFFKAFRLKIFSNLIIVIVIDNYQSIKYLV